MTTKQRLIDYRKKVIERRDRIKSVNSVSNIDSNYIKLQELNQLINDLEDIINGKSYLFI